MTVYITVVFLSAAINDFTWIDTEPGKYGVISAVKQKTGQFDRLARQRNMYPHTPGYISFSLKNNHILPDFSYKTFFRVVAHFFPSMQQFSKIAQSRQADLPASVFLTCLLSDLPSHVIFLCPWVCVCARVCVHACQAWIRLGRMCVIPSTHLTQRGEGPQPSWQCVTKCPPWTCLNEADCSNEAMRTRQSTRWARDQRALERARLDVSIFAARGQGDFVLQL